MREIKFRAYGEIQCYYLTAMGWKPEKKMCEVSSLNIKTNKCRVLYKGEHNTNEFDTFELSKVNLMQYTGLKDKNGKEIYEGDIVLWDYEKIVVSYGIQGVDAFEGIGYNLWSHYGQKQDGSRLQSEIEVIGNIYENPKLLKN